MPDKEDAIQLAEFRNGAVFSFACRSGARLVGADRRVVTTLGRYGRHTGLAWNLAEDLASVDAHEDADPIGNSLEDRAIEGRPGLSLCIAVERDPALSGLWAELQRDPDPELARRLAEGIRATGASAEVRARLVRECWAARQALQQLHPSRHRDLLGQIGSRLAWEGSEGGARRAAGCRRSRCAAGGSVVGAAVGAASKLATYKANM